MLLDDVDVACKSFCASEETPKVGDVRPGDDGVLLRFQDGSPVWPRVGLSSSLVLFAPGCGSVWMQPGCMRGDGRWLRVISDAVIRAGCEPGAVAGTGAGWGAEELSTWGGGAAVFRAALFKIVSYG